MLAFPLPRPWASSACWWCNEYGLWATREPDASLGPRVLSKVQYPSLPSKIQGTLAWFLGCSDLFCLSDLDIYLGLSSGFGFKVCADKLSLLHHEMQLTSSTYIHDIYFHECTICIREKLENSVSAGKNRLGVSLTSIYFHFCCSLVLRPQAGHFTLQYPSFLIYKVGIEKCKDVRTS